MQALKKKKENCAQSVTRIEKKNAPFLIHLFYWRGFKVYENCVRRELLFFFK